jgi:hypothetical protein
MATDSYHQTFSPTNIGQTGGVFALLQSKGACRINRQDRCKEFGAGFSDSTNKDGAVVSADACTVYDTTKERLVAERIISWWISKKSYRKWYEDEFIQQKLDFGDEIQQE